MIICDKLMQARPFLNANCYTLKLQKKEPPKKNHNTNHMKIARYLLPALIAIAACTQKGADAPRSDTAPPTQTKNQY